MTVVPIGNKLKAKLAAVQMPKLPHSGLFQDPIVALQWNLALSEKLERRGFVLEAHTLLLVHGKITT